MRHTWLEENRFKPGQPPTGAELADDLERICELYGPHTIAACFVEPIAGSTGTLVPPVGYLERLREICDRHGILLVFDEVITGFGRTGEAFAAQSFGVKPDVMTMAKAITNAAQPMGAVAVDERIYDTVVQAAPDEAIEFFHGYTYSGHPAACAAGIVVQDIYEREGIFARGRELAPYVQERLFTLPDVPAVTDVRGYGLMGGIDLAPDGPAGHRGLEATKRFWEAGLHVKFTGDTGIIAPPLVCERAHVDEIFDKAERVLRTF
jgi:beta-alanine--pyruvate transaminase